MHTHTASETMLTMSILEMPYDTDHYEMNYQGASPGSNSMDSGNAASPMSMSMSPHSMSSPESIPYQLYDITSYKDQLLGSSNVQYMNSIGFNEKSLDKQSDPYLTILEEPVDKFRFRYKSEMLGTHGSLMAKSHEKGRKVYPTVELKNWSGPAIIRCSLYQADPNNRSQHTHRLVLRHTAGDEERNDPHDVIVGENGKENIAVFQGMGIIHTAKKNIADELYRKKMADLRNQKLHPMRKLQIKEQCNQEAKDINLNTVCLCFEAFKKSPFMEPICPPVYSVPINNMKSALTGELKISRMSKSTSSCLGGDEIFLFVEKVGKKNIKVKFYEVDIDNPERVIWSDYGQFSELDVHHQYAIALRTPAYRDKEIDRPVDVFIQLFRPTDGDISEPHRFTYKPSGRITGSDRKRARNDSCFSSAELPTMLNLGELNLSGADGSFDLNAALEGAVQMDSKEFMKFYNNNVNDFANSYKAEQLETCRNQNENLDLGTYYDINDQYLRTDGTEPAQPTTEIKNPSKQRKHRPIAKDTNNMVEADYIKNDIRRYMRQVAAGLTTENMLAVKESVRILYRTGENGNSVLHTAIACAQLDIAREMLQLIILTKMTDLLNYKNNNGYTCLHIAIIHDRADYIRPLLSAGIDPNIKDEEGNTALHLAAIHGNYFCSTKLFTSQSVDVDLCNDDGLTALHIAVREKNINLVLALLNTNLNVNIKDKTHGCTALHTAVEVNDDIIVKSLLDHGQVNVNERNSSGHTPLHLACVTDCGNKGKGSLTICEMLLNANADPMLAYTSTMVKMEPPSSDDDTEDYESGSLGGHTSFDLASSNPEIRALLERHMTQAVSISKIKDEPWEHDVKAEDNKQVDKGETKIKEENNINLFDEKCLIQLSSLLDSTGVWEKLAAMLDYNHLMNILRKSTSPSRTLLQAVDVQGDYILQDLIKLLQALDQHEAVVIIDEMVARLST